MPAPFRQLNRQQFGELLATFPFKRKITAVHMHHTWKPNRAQYRGHDTIAAMWRFHTETYHWSDIAQHISIAPDGGIWLGRNWNLAPASALHHNGTSVAGPFMFEMIGDFDTGRDRFDGEQRLTTLEVIARVQSRFRLAPDTLKMHNMMSNKSCPGSSIDYRQVLGDVALIRKHLGGGVPAGLAPAALGVSQIAVRQYLQQAIEDLQRRTGRPADPPDAHGCDHDAQGTLAEHDQHSESAFPRAPGHRPGG